MYSSSKSPRKIFSSFKSQPLEAIEAGTALNDALEKSPPKKKFKTGTASSETLKENSSSKPRFFSSDNLNEKKSEVPKMPEFLFSVAEINSDGVSIKLAMKKIEMADSKEYSCVLVDSWANCNISKGDIVHVLSEPNKDGNYLINDTAGLLIVNPHYILSGTSIISSLFCLRKSSLNYKFADHGSTTCHLVLGNLLHILFQFAIKKKRYEKEALNGILMEMLRKKQIINQLYEANIDEEFIIKETSIYLVSIEKWLRENLNLGTKTLSSVGQQAQKNFQISDVCDIEESIWSPKYGIKGKLDLTIKSDIRLASFKNLSSSFKVKENSHALNQLQTHVIPVELKSGRTTFSAEHEGQVMFYALLNSERSQSASHSDFGLLLYLKDLNMKLVKISHVCLRGLIQLRNDLVYHISSNELPSELKNDERACSKCSQLRACSLLRKTSQQQDDIELYDKSIEHLTRTHKDFFYKWYDMLELEFGNSEYKQFESGELVWWKDKKDLEATGFAVFDLKIDLAGGHSGDQRVGQEEGFTIDRFFLFEFVKANGVSPITLNIKPNDMVLLSTQSDKQIGISQGFVKSISASNTRFTLLLDKNLTENCDRSTLAKRLFRLDKVNFRSSITLNYSNLIQLMSFDDTESNHHATKLRSLIIDRVTPTFQPTLSKQFVVANKAILKKLNLSQKQAAIKSFMTNDYLLIKGYPGTGKTTTIASIIASLINMDKKILFTSFTNSAVDNLLIKIVEDYGLVDFVRIGSFDRIHPLIQKYESAQLTENIQSVEKMKEFFEKKQLIAATCSSINHPAFRKIDFDYCIVDEASQVLLPTCLGPLFYCKRFILVGDLEQLPPIIKNKEARRLGMGVSLFEFLDCKEGSIELVHQYRMNSAIMDLANEFTYKGKLQCESDQIANSSLQMSSAFLSSVQKIKSNEIKKIFTSSVIFIDTSELMKPFVTDSSDSEEFRTFNKIEGEIVLQLCRLIYKNSDCNLAEHFGIIAPYNNQVTLIQNKFKVLKPLQDVEINTVDQFQGRDKRIVLMSFANSLLKNVETKEFEILNDKRRLTVAITRAKQKLIMIGSIKCLEKYKPLAKLIAILKEKDIIVNISSLDQLNFK